MNRHDTYTIYVTQSIVSLLPLLLVACYGLFLAVSRWNEHREVARITVIALGLLLLSTLASRLLPAVLSSQGIAFETLSRVLTILGLATNVMTAVAFGLLVKAAFGWRTGPTKRRWHDDGGVS